MGGDRTRQAVVVPKPKRSSHTWRAPEVPSGVADARAAASRRLPHVECAASMSRLVAGRHSSVASRRPVGSGDRSAEAVEAAAMACATAARCRRRADRPPEHAEAVPRRHGRQHPKLSPWCGLQQPGEPAHEAGVSADDAVEQRSPREVHGHQVRHSRQLVRQVLHARHHEQRVVEARLPRPAHAVDRRVRARVDTDGEHARRCCGCGGPHDEPPVAGTDVHHHPVPGGCEALELTDVELSETVVGKDAHGRTVAARPSASHRFRAVTSHERANGDHSSTTWRRERGCRR